MFIKERKVTRIVSSVKPKMAPCNQSKREPGYSQLAQEEGDIFRSLNGEIYEVDENRR